MFERALLSLIFLICSWIISFWPNLIELYNPKTFEIFIFNLFISITFLFLLYKKRTELNLVAITSSQLGLFGLFIIITIWIIADVSHLSQIQATSAILMIPSIALIAFGPYVARLLLFPLLFLLLIIPFYMNTFNTRFLLWCISVGLIIAYLVHYFVYKQKMVYGVGATGLQPGKDLIEEKSRFLIPTIIGCSMILAAPWLGDNIREFYPKKSKSIVLTAPRANAPWVGPIESTFDWNPQFQTPSATLKVAYRNPENIQNPNLVLYSVYYQSDRTIDDLLNPQNKLYNSNLWQNVEQRIYNISLSDNYSISVNETILTRDDASRIIWSWYYILGVPTVDPNLMQFLDKIRLISKYADGSGLIALAIDNAQNLDQARNSLESFIKAMYPSFELLERPEKLQ